MPTINVEDVNITDANDSGIWVMGLSIRDKMILTSRTEWLNDNLINVVQSLILQQFPNVEGLQNTLLGYTHMFIVKRNPFVQILHNGHGHWMTLSTYGCELGEVNVYDSLMPSLTLDLQEQIAAILCVPLNVKTITVRYVSTL